MKSNLDKAKTVLVLGASGMLGSAIFRYFNRENNYNTIGTIRSKKCFSFFSWDEQKALRVGFDVRQIDSLTAIFSDVKPDFVINCVGVIKQSEAISNALEVIELNASFPHRLSLLCEQNNARLIHISTDCVFSGLRGMYQEADVCDVSDMYGLSKRLGEVINQNTVTIRTSIIGHEIETNKSLVDWFLSTNDSVVGFSKAIFSGLPTIYLARVIHDFILTNADLTGLYHLSADPISKYELLEKVNDVYDKGAEIIKNNSFTIDRSLDSTKFQVATGWRAPNWDSLIDEMYRDYATTSLRNNNV